MNRTVKRLYLIVLFLLIGGLLIGARLIWIVFAEKAKWESYQNPRRIYLKRIVPTRGSILSHDGKVLAITIPFYRLAIDVTRWNPHDYPNLEDSIATLCHKLAAFSQSFSTPLSYSYFYNRIQTARAKKDRHIYLFPYSIKLTVQQVQQVKQFPLLWQGRMKGGLIVEKVPNPRFYPYENLARITLGILNQDTIPVNGIEYSFNHYLRGQDGWMVVEKVGKLEIPVGDMEIYEAQDGYNIQITLDVNIQDIAYQTLKKAIERHKAKWGVAIIMEVKTGKILAIANYPEIYNWGIGQLLEPGSTFKIATALALLKDRTVKLSDSINTGKGYYQYYDRTMSDIHPYGTITFEVAFHKSSNVAISKVVLKHYEEQPERFLSLLQSTGLFNDPVSQLIGEPKPYLLTPKETKHWSKVSLPWIAIGYSVKLTPLQLLTFVNAIANQGRYITPLLVEKVLDGNKVVQTFTSRVIQDPIAPPEVIAQLQHLLKGVVQRGTAKTIYDPELPIAGKTGTAQKLVNGKYEKMYRSSFVGYFPADNPMYSGIVLIDEPTEEGFYGGEVAAPVFYEIAKQIYAMNQSFASPLPIPKTKKIEFPISPITAKENAEAIYHYLNIPTPGQTGADFVKLHQDGKVVHMYPYSYETYLMPEMKGMRLRDAIVLASQLHLNVHIEGYGTVCYQSIPPGNRIHPQMTLILKAQP